MLVNALHAALEDRIEAFDRIGMDYIVVAVREFLGVGIANVFLPTVVDRIVAQEVLADFFVPTGFVGHEL
jgi:hypothetical protein